MSLANEGCGNEGDFLEISTNPVTWLCERDRGHYTTSSNHVTVKFNSDENGNNNHQGFKFTYVLFYEGEMKLSSNFLRNLVFHNH